MSRRREEKPKKRGWITLILALLGIRALTKRQKND